jgi:hypothetical protein
MNRNRILDLSPEEIRTQRNRILPIEGNDSKVFFDFNSGILDARLTLTRGNAAIGGHATFINSQGRVQYADQNLVRGSERCENGVFGWTKQGDTAYLFDTSVTDPTGGVGAARLTASSVAGSSAFITNTFPVSQGVEYTLTFWVRAGTSDRMLVLITQGGSPPTFPYMPATASIVSGPGSVTVNAAPNSALAITGLTTQWTKVRAYFTPTTTSSGRTVNFYPDLAAASGLSNYLWGVQMNFGRIENPKYIKTDNDTYNGPRFDYDPSTLRLKGLLIEDQIRNDALWSEDQTNAVWLTYINAGGTSTKSGKSTTLAPDGSTNGNKLTITGSGDCGLYQLLPTAALTVGKVVTVSFWVWTESGTGNCRINYYNGTTSSSGTTEAISTTPRRISRTITINSTSATSNFTISNAGSSVTLVWWGCQVEESWIPTSYVRTGATSVTRGKDYLRQNNSLFPTWFTQRQGTFVMSAIYRFMADPVSDVFPRLATFAPSVSPFQNPRLSLGYAVLSKRFFVNAATSLNATIVDQYSGLAYNQNELATIGVSYSSTPFRTTICVNGDTPTTATTSATNYESSGIAQLDFTSSMTTSAIHLKSFRFWDSPKTSGELREIVKNENTGFSPAFTTFYFSGEIGNCNGYNPFSETDTYASIFGGTDDWYSAGLQVADYGNVSFGMRVVVTEGQYGAILGYIIYNIGDSKVDVYDTELPVEVVVLADDSVAFGLAAGLPEGLAGRVEIYEWTTKRTITFFEFNT